MSIPQIVMMDQAKSHSFRLCYHSGIELIASAGKHKDLYAVGIAGQLASWSHQLLSWLQMAVPLVAWLVLLQQTSAIHHLQELVQLQNSLEECDTKVFFDDWQLVYNHETMLL